MSEIAKAITQLHRNLFNDLVEHAQTLEDERPAGSLDGLVEFLRHDLSAHFRDEDRDFYPAVEPLMKAHGEAVAGLEMDHDFIDGYIQRIAALAEELKSAAAGEQPRLRQRLRDLFIQMEAILEVHLGKEERLLVPLFEQYLPEEEQRRVLASMQTKHQ